MYFLYNACLFFLWQVIYRPLRIYGKLKGNGVYLREKHNKKILDSWIGGDTIWIHAASIGEVIAAIPIIKEIKRQHPNKKIFLSLLTENGFHMAQKKLSEVAGFFYFPFDYPAKLKEIFDIIQPNSVILIETELWPNFISIAHKRSIPIFLMNGRISENSMKYYKFCRLLFSKILPYISIFSMQTQVDQERIIKLGALPKQVTVTGNTKRDQEWKSMTEKEWHHWCHLFSIKEEPIIVAGSTHQGEEEILLDAYGKILKNIPTARLFIGIRDINRREEIRKLVKQRGYSVTLRSEIKDICDTQIIIVDTIGELGYFYGLATVVVVGGSFVPIGGHNILEPAAWGRAIIVGPHMENFKEIYQSLLTKRACITATNEKELTDILLDLIRHEEKRNAMGEQAKKMVKLNSGATQKNVELWANYLTEFYSTQGEKP